jgi:plastocyanin
MKLTSTRCGLVAAAFLFLACTAVQAQMMRPSPPAAMHPTMMTPAPSMMTPHSMMSGSTGMMSQRSPNVFLIAPRIFPQMSYPQSNYTQMFYMMPYGGYGGYGSNQSPNGSYGFDANRGIAAPPAGGQLENADVLIGDNFFQPAEITVPAGTAVKWKNTSKNFHTVTADDGSWKSGLTGEGETFVHTFKMPGTYHYYCMIHAKEMRATVIVK